MKALIYITVLLIVPLIVGLFCEMLIARRRERGFEIDSALIIACVLAALSAYGVRDKLKSDLDIGADSEASDSKPWKVQFIEPPDKDLTNFGLDPRETIESSLAPVTRTRLEKGVLYYQLVRIDDLGALMTKRAVASALQTVAAKELCNVQWKEQIREFSGVTVRFDVVNHGQFEDTIGCHLQLSIGDKLVDGVAVARSDGDDLYLVLLVPRSQGAN